MNVEDIKVERCKRTYFEHNGERTRYESAWTWICSCGDSECGSTKAIALDEWRWHKKQNNERFEKMKTVQNKSNKK
jgi:hypothetical protein